MTKHAIPYTPRNTPNRKTPPPGNTKTANTPITPSHHHTITPSHHHASTPARKYARPASHTTIPTRANGETTRNSAIFLRLPLFPLFPLFLLFPAFLSLTLPLLFLPPIPPSPPSSSRPPLIPVSCGQLREQRAFSLYRQPLAPPARQTGISAAPSHPHTLTPSHPAPCSPFSVFRFHRHPPTKKPPVRCRYGRFGESAVSAGVSCGCQNR